MARISARNGRRRNWRFVGVCGAFLKADMILLMVTRYSATVIAFGVALRLPEARAPISHQTEAGSSDGEWPAPSAISLYRLRQLLSRFARAVDARRLAALGRCHGSRGLADRRLAAYA